MKHIFFFCTPFFISIFSSAQIPDWVRGTGGSGIDDAYDVATDASGNVYTIGYFSDTVDFDPGPGSFTMVSAGGFDIYVSELDASGNFIWAKRFGKQRDDFGLGIAIDATGNVFVCGEFRDTVDFDPGPLVNNMYATVSADGFVMKLDPSGNFIWSAEIGAQGDDQAYALTLDASGNVHVTGNFLFSADFDPGQATYNLVGSSRDIFVWKLSNSGSFIWAKSMGGYSNDWSWGIVVDAGGNVYTTGSYRGIPDFDPGPATYTLPTGGGNGNAFVSKLDVSGNFVWAIAYVNTSTGLCYSESYGLAFMPNSDLIVTGAFKGVTDFDPGPGVNNVSSLNVDGYITRINPTTGSSVWINFITGPADQLASGTQVDAAGTIFVAGYYEGLSDFDPLPGIPNVPGYGGRDLFLCSFDGFGNFGGVFTAGGSGDDWGYELAIGSAGEVHMVGWYSATAVFGPTFNLTSNGNTDGFVMKFKTCSSLVTMQPVNSSLLIGGTAQFGITSPGPSFQWQENSGLGFVSLSNNVQYAGVNTATLTVSNVALLQNNNLYRCLVTAASCSLASAIATLSVYDGTGVDEKQADVHILVSPNPTDGQFQLQAPAAFSGQDYLLYDQTGRLVMNGKTTDATTTIDVRGLSSGLYFIHLEGLLQKPVKIVKQ